MTTDSSTLLQGLDVLLLEDETMISFLIEEMLQDLGAASVRHAARVDAGMKLLADKAPSLAVLDVNLAGELIFPLAEQLVTRDIPFVFLTGYGRSGVDDRWADYEVIQKPMTTETLEKTLRKVIGAL